MIGTSRLLPPILKAGARSAPKLPLDKAFERYSVEQALNNDDLSDEEIESGLVGGGDDGGVDGFYFFLNRTLMQEETDIPDRVVSADVKIVQAKYSNGFSEDAIVKLANFTRDMLDTSTSVDSYSYYSQSIKDAITSFRSKYAQVLGNRHTLTLTYYYITKSASSDLHPKVTQRTNDLRSVVKKQLSAANVDVQFWDCARLLDEVRSVPETILTLKFSSEFSTKDRAVVCLANIKEFAKFLTDDTGVIRKSLLEPNVRDYQGKRNPVNIEIRKTLTGGDGEFWWLNNGITILADDCNTSGDILTITMPEIVNGLQTSQEIFQFFQDNPAVEDNRDVLIRIIIPPDERTRNRVTKATNNQTSVAPLSLRATDQIHFDIEDRLRLLDFYYDRRKGQYRNQKKPIDRIVTIKAMAQAVMSTLMMRPNDAYGGPLKVLKDEKNYDRIFSEQNDRDMYAVCALLDRAVVDYLGEHVDSKEARRCLTYYMLSWTVASLAGTASPTADDIAAILPAAERISLAPLSSAYEAVNRVWEALGSSEKAAKGPKMRDEFERQLRHSIATSSHQTSAG